MNFTAFLERYREDSSNVRLEKDFPLVYQILRREVNKLECAEFESERVEVRNFSEKAIKLLKPGLQREWKRFVEVGKVGDEAQVLVDVALYFEYKELHKASETPDNDLEPQTHLEEFFFPGANDKLIYSIQERFKNLKPGKEMAILIYLLNKKFSLISLDNNNRNKKSRIHFVRALTGTDYKSIKGTNNFFESISGEITVNEQDEVYLRIDRQLNEMVSNG